MPLTNPIPTVHKPGSPRIIELTEIVALAPRLSPRRSVTDLAGEFFGHEFADLAEDDDPGSLAGSRPHPVSRMAPSHVAGAALLLLLLGFALVV